jgi:hypothetical protein
MKERTQTMWSEQLKALSWLAVALTSVACRGREDFEGVIFRDSSGIGVVESMEPSWTSESAWYLSSAPILSVGAQEADSAYLFHGVVGAKRLGHGRIAVADYGSHQIRYYDETGHFLTSVGREGEGPGEFRFMSLFWRLPGDTVVLSHDRGLSLFDPSGVFVRTVRPQPTPGGFSAQGVAQLDDGTILGINGTRAFSPADAGALIPNTLQFHTFQPSGTYGVFLDSFPAAPLWFVTGTTDLRRVPFHTFPTRGAAGANIYLTGGRKPEIQVRRADGTLRRIIRWQSQSQPLTSDHVARYRDYLLARASSDNARRRHEQFLNEVPMPDQLPVLGEASFLVDRAGNLWAEAYRPPWQAEAEWIVFSREGVWLGSLRTPAGFVLHDVGPDFVLGTWRDDLGVEYVRTYGLVKP